MARKVPGSCKLYTKAEAKANPRGRMGTPGQTHAKPVDLNDVAARTVPK